MEHAEEEGIIFKTLCNPVEIHANDEGFVKSITCIEMELGEPDASGRRRPIEKKGSEFELDVDTVIMSLGTSPNPLIRSTNPGSGNQQARLHRYRRRRRQNQPRWCVRRRRCRDRRSHRHQGHGRRQGCCKGH